MYKVINDIYFSYVTINKEHCYHLIYYSNISICIHRCWGFSVDFINIISVCSIYDYNDSTEWRCASMTYPVHIIQISGFFAILTQAKDSLPSYSSQVAELIYYNIVNYKINK